jgi:hypothetical protein
MISALQDLVAKGVRKLLLNLTAVTLMDSSGVSAIAKTQASLSRQVGCANTSELNYGAVGYCKIRVGIASAFMAKNVAVGVRKGPEKSCSGGSFSSSAPRQKRMILAENGSWYEKAANEWPVVRGALPAKRSSPSWIGN